MVTLEDDVDGRAGWQLEVQLVVHVDVDEGDLEATAAEEYACPPCEEDYACPICLELLLRPIQLSCGHHLCRGCWVRVLQSRSVRVTAQLTGSVACPFRCEVQPVVPEVDQVHAY